MADLVQQMPPAQTIMFSKDHATVFLGVLSKRIPRLEMRIVYESQSELMI
jgi:hypothetical protein